MKGIAFGQYYPASSVMHRLDPRMKIIIGIIYIVTSFLCQNVFSFALLLLSALFLIISVAILLFSGVISALTAVFSLILALVVMFVFDVTSLREELNIRHGKPRSTFLSSLYSYVLPLAYIALVIFLSYNGFSLWVMYLFGVLLFVLLGLPQILKVKRCMGDWFMELEAIN